MDSEKDKKELHEEGNQDDLEDEKNPESVTIITPLVTNPSPEIVLISTIRSLHDHDHILIEEGERRERIVTSLVTIANSPIGGLICDHLLEHGGATIPELVEVIPTTGATASRTLKALKKYDAIEEHGYVGPPYRPQGQPGPGVPVFIWKGADPEASIEAQKRYGDLVVSSREPSSEPTLELERQQRDEHIQELADQVEANLPDGSEDQIGPIYTILDDLLVTDQGLRHAVKEEIITRRIRRRQEDEA